MYSASLAHAYGIAGRREEASKILNELSKRSEHEFISSYDLAIAQSGFGDAAKTFHLLDAAVRERSPRVEFLGVEPRFDNLRGDSRYGALLRLIEQPVS